MDIFASSDLAPTHPKRLQTFGFDMLFCLIAGIAYGFAFIPLTHMNHLLGQSNHLGWQSALAIVSLSLCLCALPSHTGKRTGLLMILFGLGCYSIGTSWVYISIHTYGQTAAPLAVGLTALFIIALAMIQAFPWFFYPWLSGKKINTTWHGALRLAIVTALCWVIAGLLLTYIGTGFPWLLPGYVIQLGLLRQGWLPLIGIHGWDFLLLFLLSLCVSAGKHLIGANIHDFRFKPIWPLYLIVLLGLSIFIGVGFNMARWQWTKPLTSSTQFRLIQGAVPQRMKWDASYLLNILNNYDRLSQDTPSKTIVIWPEGAIPAVNTEVQPFIDYLQKVSQKQDLSFVIGIPLVDENQFYNGALAIDKDKQQTYHKRHLVPFGEYLPFEKMLRGLINFFNIPMSDFSEGDAHQASLRVRNVDIGTLICYEVAYPGLVGQSAANSNMLLAISDDTWFGRSAAAWQQLQISRVRSAETQLPMILVGNDGYTGWIDAHGHVRKLLPRYQAGTMTLTIRPRHGKTPITQFYAWLSK